MSPDVGEPERKAQNRLVKLYQEQLGYDYLGNWQYDRDNSNIEVEFLTPGVQ
jgi:type I restriction enzyme R subunit